ncbi:MAG: ABC transporter substrate-binding protein [Hyphomicrobiales bacterium]|nr:MAG: ABC transporter substrate-binding protein [Hyphomicrobiales bacterium]
MHRRTFLTGAAGLIAAGHADFALAQSAPPAEKTKVILGVGGKPLLYYLPLTIAEQKGFFKAQGLDVEINDFGGGSKSLQALIGGSVDVVTGAYEHTIRMQAKGQDIRAVLEMGRFPGIVIAVRKSLAGEIKSAADFKGRKIGVTAPGSSTALCVQYAMVKAGLKPSDAAIIGVGAGASPVAAVKKGEIEVLSHLEPVISKLEQDGDIEILIDTRTEAGSKALFGGSNPAACLYLRQDFIAKNPGTTQRLVNGLMAALRWIGKATPEEIADAVPTNYHLGDKPLYVKAVAKSIEGYSKTGIITPDGMASIMDMLKKLDPEFANVQVDLAKTFNGSFAAKA